MAYLLLACPKCHAAYKIPKEHAQTEVTCRACGHRWVPGQAALRAAPPPPLPEAAAPAAQEPAPASTPPTPATESPAPAAPTEAESFEKHSFEMGSPLGALEAMAKGSDVKGPAPAGPPEPPARAAPQSALEALAQAARAATPGGQSAPAEGEARASGGREEKLDPLVGAYVNGFKILSRLGSGGFGVVYKAFDTTLERSVAIKMLPPKIAKAGQGLVDRFLREARSAAKLAHQNIVTIHQICPYKDTYYIVMELVEGGALHEYLAAQKHFAPAEATRIIRSAAEGLGHAHRRGIIHRDVKPGNIMMTNDGQVKVSDFGLARDVLQGHDIVGAGHSLGTPRYMAPEQALGEEPAAASDLYSLAATYYALLTGRAPFDAATDRVIMKKHVTEPVPDPRQYVPDLPVAVYRFFEKAMAKQPEDRYVTAEEFVAALDRLDFSATEAGASTPQAIVAQLGPISAEDRGAHLTQALGRAVKRAQRQRTPMPEGAVGDLLSGSTASARKVGWKLWLFIGVGLALVIAGAIVVAVVLSKGHQGVSTQPPTPTVTPPTGNPPEPGRPPTLPTTKPPEPGRTPTPPTTKPPEPGPPPTITTSNHPLESAAQAALREAKEYAAKPNLPPEEAIRTYKETVIDVYPNTKAAAEAQKAIDQLMNAAAPSKTPKK